MTNDMPVYLRIMENGEELTTIATVNKLTVDEIEGWNGIDDDDLYDLTETLRHDGVSNASYELVYVAGAEMVEIERTRQAFEWNANEDALATYLDGIEGA